MALGLFVAIQVRSTPTNNDFYRFVKLTTMERKYQEIREVPLYFPKGLREGSLSFFVNIQSPKTMIAIIAALLTVLVAPTVPGKGGAGALSTRTKLNMKKVTAVNITRLKSFIVSPSQEYTTAKINPRSGLWS
jgi:hypothetical protein